AACMENGKKLGNPLTNTVRDRSTFPHQICLILLYLVGLGDIAAKPLLATPWEPEKPITIVAPSNPGGGWDQTARYLQRTIIAENLSPVSMEVANHGGAGGTIGLAELVQRYHGNPYQLMVSGFTMTGAVLMHGSEQTLLSTTPIARLTSEYQAIGVRTDSPIQSLQDLLKRFKDDPSKITWGGGSAGSADHIFAALLAEKIGVAASRINYVAFTGGGEAAAALMGGQVTVGVSGFAEWGGLVEANRVRLLAISSPQRLPGSNIPTFRELGIDVEFQNWRAIVAAPGVSDKQIIWLTNMVTNVRNSQSWQDILKRNNWQDSFLTGEPFKNFISADSATTKGLLKRMGLGTAGQGYAPIGPYFFPILISIGLGLCVLVLLFEHLRKAPLKIAEENTEPPATTLPNYKRFGLAAALFVLYILGMQHLGFLLTTPFFFATMSRLMGSEALLRDLVIGVVLSLAIGLIFEHLLHVDIP
ncbi:MAG: tripartite tricarboxylate transporter TctB family protein, partial [Pseudomonadales bacterium]|nr:tripartite tricarboxylate transporter TctB family protein [Pseudomonadales bacterium]